MRCGLLIAAVLATSLSARPVAAGSGDDSSYLLQFGWESRADRFFGLAQLALAHSHAEEFYGGLQLGLAGTRGRLFIGGVQIGAVNLGEDLYGLAQLGLFNSADGEVIALVQAGGFNSVHRMFVGVLQLGGFNTIDRGFGGVIQLALVNAIPQGDFFGVLQVGILNRIAHRYSETVIGIQAGVANLHAGELYGLAQAGLYNAVEGESIALVGQIGLFNHHTEGRLWAATQCCVANVAQTFCGLAQMGAFNYITDTLYGSQLGLLNLGRSVHGVQIGLVNVARKLRGLQIGLVNISRHGGLPVSVIANVGF